MEIRSVLQAKADAPVFRDDMAIPAIPETGDAQKEKAGASSQVSAHLNIGESVSLCSMMAF